MAITKSDAADTNEILVMHREADEKFLSRWSRRKHDVQQDAQHADPVTADASQSPIAESESDVEGASPPPTDADMPPIESLDEGSDYSPFFSDGVSEELRKLALRKLFRSAVFNVRDGLDDYDEDFRSFAALGDIVTADMRLQTERRAAAQQEAEQQEVAEEPGMPVASDDAEASPDEAANPSADDDDPQRERESADVEAGPDDPPGIANDLVAEDTTDSDTDNSEITSS
jgi:hypothetical protein